MRLALIAPEGDGHGLLLGAALERMGHDVLRIADLPEHWLTEPPSVPDAHLPWLGASDVRTPLSGRLQAALTLEAAGSRPLIRATTLLRVADRAAWRTTLVASALPLAPAWLVRPGREEWPAWPGPLRLRPRYGGEGATVTSMTDAWDALGADVAGGGLLEPVVSGVRYRILCSGVRTIVVEQWSGDDVQGVWERRSSPAPEDAMSLARRAVAALGGGVMAVEIGEDADGRMTVRDVSLEGAFALAAPEVAGEVAAALLAALDRPGDRFAQTLTLR